MPSARDLSGQWGVSHYVITRSVPICLGYPSGIFYPTNEHAERIRLHLLSHRIHLRGFHQISVAEIRERLRGAAGRFTSQAPSPIATSTIRNSTITPATPPVSIPTTRSSQSVSLNEVNVGVGCDPEFEVNDANGVFIPFRGTTRSAVGCDGDERTGELRPQWDCDPLIVYARIDSLLDQVKEQISPTHQVIAGEGKEVSTGGHIHISGIGDTPSSSLLSALDNFIGIPIRNRCNGRRKHSSYNTLSSYRVQFHGGFEYRTSPSWLAHPILTKGALVIAAILTRNHESLPNTTEELADLANNAEERVAVESFYSFLYTLERDGKYLESLEVLRMWGKRQSVRVVRQGSEASARLDNSDTISYPLTFGTDQGLPIGMSWHHRVEYRIVGARESRPDPNAIYVPRNDFSESLRRSLEVYCLRLLMWEMNDIGLGSQIRSEGRGEAALRALLTEMDRLGISESRIARAFASAS